MRVLKLFLVTLLELIYVLFGISMFILFFSFIALTMAASMFVTNYVEGAWGFVLSVTMLIVVTSIWFTLIKIWEER